MIKFLGYICVSEIYVYLSSQLLTNKWVWPESAWNGTMGYSTFFYFPSVLQKQYDVVPSITATTIPAEPPSLPGEVHIYSGKQITNPQNFHLISRKWFHSLSQHPDHACCYNSATHNVTSWHLDDIYCLCASSLACHAESRGKSLWVSEHFMSSSACLHNCYMGPRLL